MENTIKLNDFHHNRLTTQFRGPLGPVGGFSVQPPNFSLHRRDLQKDDDLNILKPPSSRAGKVLMDLQHTANTTIAHHIPRGSVRVFSGEHQHLQIVVAVPQNTYPWTTHHCP
jgi:hypothetical protein